jgi:hypothetical protein
MGLFDFLTEGKPVEAVPVSSTQQTVLPDWYTNYAMDILANQQQLAQRPFQAYADKTGAPIPRFADFTPDQQQGFQATREGAFTFRPELGTASTQTQGTFGRSGLSAAQPNLQQAGQYTAQSTGPLGLTMAQPYLGQAGQSSVQNIGQYMNPYTEQVVNRIGQLGTRALKEQVLPGIESEMIRAGQFGGSRQAEITGRAIRDAIEGISAQQSQALQTGFQQAAGLSQADLARQAQLASTAGGLGFQQQGALAQAGQQMGTLGQQMGALYNADTANQLAAANQLASIAQQRQTQELTGAGALQQIGAQQQALAQKNLDFAREEWEREQNLAQEQNKGLMGALQGVAGAVPQAVTKEGTEVPGTYSPSLLSTIGQAFATYKGLTG